jgi:hypothetical protein
MTPRSDRVLPSACSDLEKFVCDGRGLIDRVGNAPPRRGR